MPKPDWKPLPTLSGPFQTLRSWNSSLLNFDGIQPPTCSQSKRPDCRIIVLTDTEDEDVLLEAVEVGAAGFLTKSSSLSELIETIRSVMRGETIIPPHLLSGVLRRLISQRILQDQARRQRQRLTRRGKQALALLAKGASSEAIAEELTISPPDRSHPCPKRPLQAGRAFTPRGSSIHHQESDPRRAAWGGRIGIMRQRPNLRQTSGKKSKDTWQPRDPRVGISARFSRRTVRRTTRKREDS